MFSSHRSLWNECLRLGEPLLIMEDDIEFSTDIKSVLSELKGLSREFEYIRLGVGLVALCRDRSVDRYVKDR